MRNICRVRGFKFELNWTETSADSVYSEVAYRGKLVVELGQHGVVNENGRVPLKPIQLVQETLLVLLGAVPGGHWLEEGLACRVTPLQDHNLNGEKNTVIVIMWP